METLMIIVAGILFTIGTYLVLSKSLLRVILGTSLISHGAHLMLLSVSGLKHGAPPLFGEGSATYTDPLPQALILTSIVISFGLTAFFLVLGYRAYVELGTDDLNELRGTAHE